MDRTSDVPKETRERPDDRDGAETRKPDDGPTGVRHDRAEDNRAPMRYRDWASI
jgi:hypothetical protein